MMSCTLFLALLCFSTGSFSLSLGSTKWDHLMFVQQWPQTACMFAKGHKCDIPDYVDSWTIHGIWPNLGKERGPNYCNPSWKFDESKISDLEESLGRHWPNLYDDTPKTDFWKHEWEKHGTCAASLPALDMEHKYFGAGLALHKVFDLSSFLNKSQIVPSDSGYKKEDIIHALESTIHAKVCVECKYSRDAGQMLFQTVVCLNKDIHPIDCPACEEECWSDETVGYPPIHHPKQISWND